MICDKRPEGPNAASFNERSYSLYDGHGNMIATLAKNGVGYNVANEKKYDVWGAVRSSTGAGTHIVNPNKQYCANLGHTFDGESSLIYMRARYYEPSSGRFISEDPAGDGNNWFAYCKNNPISYFDEMGTTAEVVAEKWKLNFSAKFGLFAFLAAIIEELLPDGTPQQKAFKN